MNQTQKLIIKRFLCLIFVLSVSISACHTNVTKTAGASGQADPKDKGTPDPVAVTFSKMSVGKADTLKSALLNNTDHDIVIALRCGYYLEMSYQESVGGKWSENKEMPYMNLRCPTHMRTIKPHEKFEFSVPCSLFNSGGRFRLLIPFTADVGNTNQTLTSSAFQIR